MMMKNGSARAVNNKVHGGCGGDGVGRRLSMDELTSEEGTDGGGGGGGVHTFEVKPNLRHVSDTSDSFDCTRQL